MPPPLPMPVSAHGARCRRVYGYGAGGLQSMKEVEETWRVLKFNVQQYTKGTSDRGHILGTIDEVTQTLDDNAMQLQGMLSSRFIGPFLNSVQNWEKALSHISEVLEVRTIRSVY